MSELVLRLAGDATVRAMITVEGEHVVSVYDFMNLACPGNSKSWASVTWSNLIKENSQFRHELSFTMVHLKYLGVRKGNNTRSCKTPVMTLRGLQRLLMILGGRVAAEFRMIVEGVFTRYMAGDRTMLEEIRSNSASSAPIHQAYRQALAQEPVLDAAGTKRQLDREDMLFELELQERKLALEERKSRMPSELQAKNMQNVQMFAGLMTSLNPEWKNDARLRLQLEDSVKNAFFTPVQPLITNGEAQGPLTRSIDVSTVAQDLGVRLKDGDRLAIGKLWKKRYFETYNEAPPLHDQFVNGAVRKVCSYTERDRVMGESVIREYVCNKPR
jgi:hypothetical protein